MGCVDVFASFVSDRQAWVVKGLSTEMSGLLLNYIFIFLYFYILVTVATTWLWYFYLKM